MIFHEICLLADDSHEISYLISLRKLGMTSQNVSSAAVVIGALRVKQRYKVSKDAKIRNRFNYVPSMYFRLDLQNDFCQISTLQ